MGKILQTGYFRSRYPKPLCTSLLYLDSMHILIHMFSMSGNHSAKYLQRSFPCFHSHKFLWSFHSLLQLDSFQQCKETLTPVPQIRLQRRRHVCSDLGSIPNYRSTHRIRKRCQDNMKSMHNLKWWKKNKLQEKNSIVIISKQIQGHYSYNEFQKRVSISIIIAASKGDNT